MVRINLLAVRVSKKKQAGSKQLAIGALVLVGALAGNFWWSMSRADALSSRQGKVLRTKAEIAQLEKIIGEVNDIKQQQAAVKDKLAVLDKLKAGRTGPVRMLDELASITPKRLWLKQMDEKNKSVAFSGVAATIEDVSAFMSALGKSEHFSAVELKKTAAKSEGKLRAVEFTLTAKADYTPGVKVAAAPEAAAGAKAR